LIELIVLLLADELNNLKRALQRFLQRWRNEQRLCYQQQTSPSIGKSFTMKGAGSHGRSIN
jgi:hypothetical protein